jgi:cell division protein FtsQ
MTAPAQQAAGAFARFLNLVGTILLWGLGIVGVIAFVWGLFAVEQFVVADKRFTLVGPPEPGIESEHFTIYGVTHAAEKQITDVFLRDFGRSIYLCPIAERRRSLLAIDWVQDATVSRIWPNRIIVRIRERKPVAVAQIPGPEGVMVYSLIDADGVMLDPRRSTKLALPVLNGISPSEREEKRRERVKRFLRLQTELGSVMSHVSEIDVSEPDNIRIVYAIDNRALTLMLGNQKFLERLQSFTDNYTEIRKRLGNATVLDLRLKDRITAVAAAEEGE